MRMKTALCCLLLSLPACVTGAFAQGSPKPVPKQLAAGPIVTTDKGKVEGKLDEVTGKPMFLGIPYAASPAGALRWKPPADVKAWPGVRKAVAFGTRCPQVDDGIWSKPSAYSEDCLYLNVWTPATGSGRRPVMFYIHGGGFLAGDSGDMGLGPLLNGAHLAAERDVVVVTINYRLGALGFLVHPALDAENGGRSGNYGLLDMIAALKWVQANIENFGGDPKKVMIFGHSAGATATCAVLVSPLAKDLFASAAIQSGWCGAATAQERRDAGVKVAEKLGCRGNDANVTCLRRLPPRNILREVGAFDRSYYIFAPWQTSHTLAAGATVDGYVLPDVPLNMLKAGTHNHVPLIIGSTHDEFEFFISDLSRIITCHDHVDYLRKQFGTDANTVLHHYPCPFGFARGASVQAGGDFYFTCPMRRAARAAAASQTEPVYQYLFSYPVNSITLIKASHLSDIPYVFGTFLETATPAAWYRHMELYWTNFAANGDPNAQGLGTWSRYDRNRDNFINFGLLITEETNLKNGRCDFWDTWQGPF
jgi:para-nitrobenzyl esterase